jgi:putative ABC transport system permease protein
MLQDYKLGVRMLLKYPGLTLAGGLALAIAIGVGATWYDVTGKILSPAIPLPAGDRLVTIDTRHALTREAEPRVAHDFLEWRREARTLEQLGAYRTDVRNLAAGGAAPEPVQVAELTAAAFGAARVPPLLGRPLLGTDDIPGAPSVVILGYDVWRRVLGGRLDAVGSTVIFGGVPTTVIGVMPRDFAYPWRHEAWTPLPLRASYAPLEGAALTVIARLAPGVSPEQADAEIRLLGQRTARAFPATHAHLRPHVQRLGDVGMSIDALQLGLRNVPVLLILCLACLSVGTLVYARTATREGEIAVRSALGASRARIVGQLFIESLVLATIAAAAGLVAADRVITFGVEIFDRSSGGVPFWITPGLRPSTIVYAGALAAVSAAMLSLLPALNATRTRLHTRLAERGSGGATLRFGRIWIGAMIVQVALTAIAIPTAMEGAHEARLKLNIRASFPSREYLSARLAFDQPFGEDAATLEGRRAQMFDALSRRLAQEPGVMAVAYADRVPGRVAPEQAARVEPFGNTSVPYDGSFRTVGIGPGYLDVLGRPAIAGRALQAGDWNPAARTVVVNEAFARDFASRAGRRHTPLGARLTYSDGSYEIVGIVRNLGLDPDDSGNEAPFVFRPTPAGGLSSLAIIVRMRGNPAPLAARLPALAASIDARVLVRDAEPLDASIRERDTSLATEAGAFAAVTFLVLFLSALGIFSLVSVTVSRRTREIGLRTALGASARQLLTGIVSRSILIMGGGVAAGGVLLLTAIAFGAGPSGRPDDDLPLFTGYLAITAAVMLAACLLACIGPAARALRINPTDALREG